MRSRKTWGILGSFAGIASSVAVLAYSTVFLLATTSPVSASSNCLSEEIAFALAEADEYVASQIYTWAVGDYGLCMVNTGGPCTGEQINMAIAAADYSAATSIRQQAQFDLTMCQSF